MNLEWLHPALLGAGAAAVLGPVLLHLIHRRRGTRIAFSAVRFLTDTELPTARHLRLKDILLLLLRVLAVLALAVWVARPFRQVPAGASQLGDGPAAIAVVVDNSFSLLYSEGGRTRLAAAQDSARALIESLREGDRAVLLTVVPGENQVGALTSDQGRLLRALSSVGVSYQPADPSGAVRRALDALQGAPEASRRIYLFTDLQRAGWTPLDPAAPGAGEEAPVPVILVDVRGEPGSANHAVLSSRLGVSQGYSSSAQNVDISVARYGEGGPAELRVALFGREELLSQGIAEPPVGGVQSKTLSYDAAKSVPPEGRVEIERDALPVDDVSYVVLRSIPPVEALLVDGDSRPVDYQSETFFLASALNPEQHAGSRVRAKVIRPDALGQTPLGGVQVVVLANVAAADLGGRAWEEIGKFVERGGGLLLALGDQVDPDEYNNVAGKLLPARLRGKLDVSSKSFSHEAGELHASRLTQADLHHPALRVFGQEGEPGFGRASFRAYMLTEPYQGRDTAVLLRFGNGAPALLEERLGKGRVLLWTSTFDLSWSDFAIKPLFLPLVHQVLYYLSDTLRDGAGSSFRVGEGVPLRPPSGARSARVVRPDGTEVDLAVPEGAPDLPVAFDKADLPGIYEVRWQGPGGGRAGSPFWFAAALLPEESNLEPLGAEELSALLHLPVEGVGTRGGDVTSARGLFSRHRRAEYWKAAAWALAVFLFLESAAGAALGAASRRRRA